jgi:hypothetical protein
MKNKSHISLIHKKWHRIIEGQIKGCINEHPEYFNITHEKRRGDIINSLAKRIVGEIVAGGQMAGNDSEDRCRRSVASDKSSLESLELDMG